jgi:hypothetical protein
MTKEIPNPSDAVDSAHRIETIVATKGGEEAIKALSALSHDANSSWATPYILEQIKKDSGGDKYLVDLGAAWLHDNESVVVNSGQAVSSYDVNRTAGFLKLSGGADPLATAMLDICQTNFTDIAKAAGKGEKDSLSDADLAKSVQALDYDRATSMRHQVVESDDAKMINTLLADNGRLLKRVASMRDSGHGHANEFVRYGDLEEFLKVEKNNPGMFKPEEVAAVQRLKDEWYTFRKFGGKSFYVDKDTLAQGLGISGDEPSKVMDQVAKGPAPVAPVIEAQNRPPAPPPTPREAPHPLPAKKETHKKVEVVQDKPVPPLPPERKKQIADAVPHCKSLDDALKIRDGEGPWACAVRLCELTKTNLTNREMLALAIILKSHNPPTNGVYRTGDSMHLPSDFGSTSAGLVSMQEKLRELA